MLLNIPSQKYIIILTGDNDSGKSTSLDSLNDKIDEYFNEHRSYEQKRSFYFSCAKKHTSTKNKKQRKEKYYNDIYTTRKYCDYMIVHGVKTDTESFFVGVCTGGDDERTIRDALDFFETGKFSSTSKEDCFWGERGCDLFFLPVRSDKGNALFNFNTKKHKTDKCCYELITLYAKKETDKDKFKVQDEKMSEALYHEFKDKLPIWLKK
jgi:hypothetical protein